MLKRLLFSVLWTFVTTIHAAQQLDHVVAQVNDSVITASELDTQTELLRQQLLAKRSEIPSESILRKQVLQHLIDIDLQLQLAKRNDLSVDDADLDSAINKIAEQNNINLEQLQTAVGQQGYTWSSYRENVRKEMLLARLQQKAVAKDIQVSPEQIEDYLKTADTSDKSKSTYRIQNIVIPVSEEPTPEELKKAWSKAQDLLTKIKKGQDFGELAIAESSGTFALEGGDLGERHLAELPDIFAKEVVKMKTGQVAGPLRTGNGYQIIKLVSINGNDDHHFIVKTHVRHILIKPDASMTNQEALRQVNNIYQQVKSGKDFAQMAKQYSIDVNSAIKGGDLGWVSEGELVPEFEKAMDALSAQQISKPIKSVFGWHIIQVLERKKIDDSASYQRQQVRQFLQQKKFSEAVQTWQQHLRAEAYVKVMDKELA